MNERNSTESSDSYPLIDRLRLFLLPFLRDTEVQVLLEKKVTEGVETYHFLESGGVSEVWHQALRQDQPGSDASPDKFKEAPKLHHVIRYAADQSMRTHFSNGHRCRNIGATTPFPYLCSHTQQDRLVIGWVFSAASDYAPAPLVWQPLRIVRGWMKSGQILRLPHDDSEPFLGILVEAEDIFRRTISARD